MKVVLLAPTPPPAGGIAGWTERMKKATLKNGWSVVVVDEKQNGHIKLFSQNGFSRNYIDEWKRCRRIWHDLKNAVNDESVKVVHSCIPSTTFAMMREYICALISHKNNKKFIVHFRCTVPNTTRGKIGAFMLKRLCEISDYIIVLNNQSRDYVSSLVKTPISVIPNFVNTNELDTSVVIRETISKVIYVGGVIETKGAFEAFELADLFPDIEFEFVGNIPDENRLIAKEHDNVTITGELPHDAVKDKLLSADVFLFLTHFYGEGFSNALCEAMGVGMPCLVTDWAANADMVDDGKGGFVVPIHSVKKAAIALRKLMDKQGRIEMSEYNRRKVQKYYSQQSVIDQYVDVYEQLI